MEQSGSYQWSLLENLPIVQVNFGVYPFYRVSIENGNITLSEGDLGLPDEQLYYYHRDHPVNTTVIFKHFADMFIHFLFVDHHCLQTTHP